MDSDLFVNTFYKNTLITLFHLSVYLGLQLSLFLVSLSTTSAKIFWEKMKG